MAKRKEVVVWVFRGKNCCHYESEGKYQSPLVLPESQEPHMVERDCGCIEYCVRNGSANTVQDIYEDVFVVAPGEKRKYRVRIEEIVTLEEGNNA